ncbi:hypothetical protein TrRE_jg92, partial [Triparma retinervis]
MGGAGSVMSNFTHTKPPRPGLFVCEGIAGTKPLLPGGVPGAHPLEALVVTVGPHGCPVLSSSRDIHEENTLPPSTFVAIVLDPRSLTNESSLLCSEVGLLAAAVAFQSMFLKSLGTYKPRFIRSDDYLQTDGNLIIAEMLERDKRVYPASEAAGMRDMLFSHARRVFEERSWTHHVTSRGKNAAEIAVGLGSDQEDRVAGTFKAVFDDKSTHLAEIDRKTLKEWLRSELVDSPEHVSVNPVRPINACSAGETYVCFTKEAQTKLKFAAIDAHLFTQADCAKKPDELRHAFPGGAFDASKASAVVAIAFPEDLRFTAKSPKSILSRFLTLHREAEEGMDRMLVFSVDSKEKLGEDLFM